MSEDESTSIESSDLEDDGLLDPADTLEGRVGTDSLDTGYEPPDRWSAGEGFGTTLQEERQGESLDQLLAEEEPDVDPYAEPPRDSENDPELDEDPMDEEDEEPRSGRLVAEDEGAHPDEESELVARDVGIDAGAAGAEEAAVHIISENEI